MKKNFSVSQAIGLMNRIALALNESERLIESLSAVVAGIDALIAEISALQKSRTPRLFAARVRTELRALLIAKKHRLTLLLKKD